MREMIGELTAEVRALRRRLEKGTTPPPPVEVRQYNREETARALGYSVSTLDRIRGRRLIHPNQASRRVLYSPEEIQRFRRECSQTIDAR